MIPLSGEYIRAWFSLYRIIGIDINDIRTKIKCMGGRIKNNMYHNFSQHLYRINETFISLLNLKGKLVTTAIENTPYHPKKTLDQLTEKIQLTDLKKFEFESIYGLFGRPNLIYGSIVDTLGLSFDFTPLNNYSSTITVVKESNNNWKNYNLRQKALYIHNIKKKFRKVSTINGFTEYKSRCPRMSCTCKECYCVHDYRTILRQWLYYGNKFNLLKKNITSTIDEEPIECKKIPPIVVPTWYIHDSNELLNKIENRSIGPGDIDNTQPDTKSLSTDIFLQLFTVQLLLAKKMFNRLSRVSKLQDFMDFKHKYVCKYKISITMFTKYLIYYEWLLHIIKVEYTMETRKFAQEMKPWVPLIKWYINRKMLFPDFTFYDEKIHETDMLICGRNTQIIENIIHLNDSYNSLTYEESSIDYIKFVEFE
jgi:hypothetical protein